MSKNRKCIICSIPCSLYRCKDCNKNYCSSSCCKEHELICEKKLTSTSSISTSIDYSSGTMDDKMKRTSINSTTTTDTMNINDVRKKEGMKHVDNEGRRRRNYIINIDDRLSFEQLDRLSSNKQLRCLLSKNDGLCEIIVAINERMEKSSRSVDEIHQTLHHLLIHNKNFKYFAQLVLNDVNSLP
ncbi:hypothetical protein SNEBB_002090 [Seison nebaliae]|nr:hypothetical protein SNEBB_002090 [Seison nebaliae]